MNSHEKNIDELFGRSVQMPPGLGLELAWPPEGSHPIRQGLSP